MTGFELAYLLDKYAVTFKDPAIYTCWKHVCTGPLT